MTVADHPKGYMQTIDVDAARLADAKRNLEAVDVVGLTEHHADFVDELAERFGWRLKREVRANAAPDESPEVGESFRRRIAADNAIDIEFYEFARHSSSPRGGTDDATTVAGNGRRAARPSRPRRPRPATFRIRATSSSTS